MKPELVLAECRHGRFLFFPHDFYIGGSLARYGEYSEIEVEFLKRMIQPGDFIVEAGANIGSLTVPLAQAVGPAGRVFAYEPQRIIFEVLCANVALNGCWNVFPHQKGLSNDDGALGVPEIDYAQPGNFGAVELESETEEMVDCLTIDSLDMPKCRLIKIDVQGMEDWVLTGAEDTIMRCRPFLYVENDEKRADLIEQISGMDYDVYWHMPPLFNPENFRRVTENAYPNVVSFNMIGVPHELRDRVTVTLDKA